ncbi:calcium-binding protein [Couchioplanes caeruleus]|uniref:calcium-binding protein n=1 Tax=Couchioplanes caeruleus TaxID=56438 RepID=UPI0020BF91AC|nr:calcium-binding protein [Couchioplanes caeruleus]UQU65214.1 calcium-binding protein [Couchioplanes caeruleus]
MRIALSAAVAGLLTAGGTLIAGPAWAASSGVAKVVGDTKVQYTAARGKANKVVVTRSGRTFTIDDVVSVKAGAGCKAVSGDTTKVRCTTPKNPTWFFVYTGDKNDSIKNSTDLGMTARAGSGNNWITGGPKHDDLYADDGADTIWGAGGDDYIYSAGGKDIIYGGTGSNELIGGPGNDTIYGGPDFDRIRPDSGNDVAHGGAGDDYFEESSGSDVLYGDDGMDEFFQNESDGRGAQDMHGGPGWDRVNYYFRTGGVVVDADGKKKDDGARGEGDSVGADIEGIDGSQGNDWLAGNTGDGWISGNEGNDKLYGYSGADDLNGGTGNDLLDGGNGNDNLHGDFGSDVMLGGPGVDGVDYYDRLVTVVADLDGKTGDDGSAGEKDTIGADVENLVGGWGNDTLTGSAAANHIDGGHGSDVIRGGAGNDTLDGGEGIAGGVDKVYGEAGDDVLTGGDYDEHDRYVLDGGTNTEVGDACVPGRFGTGEFVNCERSEA